jgi:hypothetical protein
VHKNRVHAASGNGIDVTPSAEPDQGNEDAPPTNVTVSKNTAEHAKLAGLHMAINTADVSVTGNTALLNGVFDCQDESSGSGTLGTANSWNGNFGVKSDPAELCSPPPPTTDKPGHGKGHHKKHKKHHKPDPCTCQKQHPKAY